MRNTILMAKEHNTSGALLSTFTAEYQPDEYAEVFTAAERSTLDAGQVVDKPHRHGITRWVSLTALGRAALA